MTTTRDFRVWIDEAGKGTNIFCSEECAGIHFEYPEDQVFRGYVFPPLAGGSTIASLLVERATCDNCGLNLMDLQREHDAKQKLEASLPGAGPSSPESALGRFALNLPPELP